MVVESSGEYAGSRNMLRMPTTEVPVSAGAAWTVDEAGATWAVDEAGGAGSEAAAVEELDGGGEFAAAAGGDDEEEKGETKEEQPDSTDAKIVEARTIRRWPLPQPPPGHVARVESPLAPMVTL